MQSETSRQEQENAANGTADEDAIRQTLATDVDIWNSVEPWTGRAMEDWGNLYTDDVDYISGAGHWLKGKREIVATQQKNHDTLVAQHATYKVSVERISFLKPDVALVHAAWEMTWASGATVEVFKAILGIVMAKHDARWLIRAAQLTETNTH